ncbi:sn-1-specific diacylglycerol lipase ABHD11 isoform X3 [Euwallacea fornicatus]|uniref:sn-1-specific diacylglycerol lipase ABHD11 isoform X3 n=1 Tax=Euwallacea fornicatus TaxID=995702 RepID=UPI00338E1C5B
MSPAQNFSQKQPYSALDLAYISYQNTDTTFGNVKRNEVTAPLLILHGLLGSKSNFHTTCKRYHGGFKPKRLVYAVDLRNHGDSPQLNHNTYEDMMLDVLNFVRVMRLTKIYLLGHDIGGRIGMLISLKYPEIIEKLIVVDASPISTSHNFQIYTKILQILNTMILPANLSPEQARAHVINRLSTVVKNKGLMALVLMNLTQIIGGSYTWRFNKKVLLDHLQELGSFPNVHNVKYEGPVLFVGGGKSDYIQRSDFPKILQLFPNAELKYIEGAGHWVHAEKPSEFLKITMEFLNKTAEV